MKNTLILIVSGIVLIIVLAGNACHRGKTNQVVVNYVPPKNPEYQHIYTLLKEERHTLEKIQEFLSPFRLRWPVEISLTECDGEADAWYGDGTITVCYEYVDELWRTMPEETTVDCFENAAIVHIEGYMIYNRELMSKVLRNAKEAQARVSLDLASFSIVEESKEALDEMVADSYLPGIRMKRKRLKPWRRKRP